MSCWPPTGRAIRRSHTNPQRTNARALGDVHHADQPPKIEAFDKVGSRQTGMKMLKKTAIARLAGCVPFHSLCTVTSIVGGSLQFGKQVVRKYLRTPGGRFSFSLR